MPSITRELAVITLLSLPATTWAVEPSLQDFSNLLSSPEPVVIYRAKQIVTL